MLAATFLAFLGTWLITPRSLVGSRVWLFPLMFAPLVLGLSLPIGSRFYRIFGVAIIVLNLAALATNYFYGFLITGGSGKMSVYVGGRFDNSLAFMDIRPTVDKLSELEQTHIYIEEYGLTRLQFLLPKVKQPFFHTFDSLRTLKDPSALPVGTRLVLRRDPSEEPADRQVMRFASANGQMTGLVLERSKTMETRQFNVFELVGRL